jgi:calcineurin-like phosphoesterase family protein
LVSKWSSGYRNFASVDEMNDTIFNRINEIVGYNDELIIVGDFSFGDKKLIPQHRDRINCKNVGLVYGNHDEAIRKNKDYQDLFMWCKDRHEFYYNKTLIICDHYAMGTWLDIGKGAINLFGHSHLSYQYTRGRQMDVCVEGNNYYPYHMDEIMGKMANVLPFQTDHHTANTNTR